MADYSRLGGTADSADFQGPIARPVSEDFRHFASQIATEYDGDAIPALAEYSRPGGTADSADFQGPIARPFSDDFRHFFTQIATEHDADPIPNVAFGRGFTLCAFNALLSLVRHVFSHIANIDTISHLCVHCKLL